MRKDLVTQGVDRMLDGIAGGDFVVGQAFPAEADLAAYLEVSRPTMREVIRILADRGIVEVKHGRGTFLVPQSQWRSVETLVGMVSRSMGEREVGDHLVEIRRMIEVGSCGHAAARATKEDVAEMRRQVERYEAASEAGIASECRDADMAFHQQIFLSTRNPFLTAIIQPLNTALSASRELTSSIPEVRERAAWHHRQILSAIEAGDEEGAKNAMRAHMDQTSGDIDKFLE
ncbi:MAG: FadR/GntR family transcriptional regulator [Corynebacterium glutamicum]|uniref:FadR/GntR family transcriptional regulator n=1 Tax=Corynebacterium glutamicum TaxID=1718 RepID=UPI00117D123B|nr:FadR/GntR family transcriptional regulator [Corynebacterium glutamicum]MDO5372259.1 FadR/GntR family transcriptional regulator [Corynebacterium glutamicum]QDQ21919.1 FadR family transcriptional regulator [Corynebacterium glutamicum]QDQ24745.1 FadR family transcriptional regulator [Corynebacterium glutamicum]